MRIRLLMSLCLMLAPGTIAAQQFPIEMPPLLVGKWHYPPGSRDNVERCGPIAEARGMTITASGQIIANNGYRTCTVHQFKVNPVEHDDIVGSWSYSGECIVRDSSEPRRIPMYGWMLLEISERDKQARLIRRESQLPQPTTIWEAPPRMDIWTDFERCPTR